MFFNHLSITIYTKLDALTLDNDHNYRHGSVTISIQPCSSTKRDKCGYFSSKVLDFAICTLEIK